MLVIKGIHVCDQISDDTWLDCIDQGGGADDGHDDEWELWDAEFQHMVSSFWEIDGPN